MSRRRVNTAALLRRAVDAVNGGDLATGFDLAVKVLGAGTEEDAKHVAVHAAMHMAPDAAAEAFGRLAELQPRDPAILNDWGGVLCQGARYEDAERALRRALEVRPGDGATLANLAHALTQLDRLDDAETAARQAVAAAPEHAAAHNGLGVVLERQGRIEDSVAAYRRAAQLEPAERAYQDNLLLALIVTGGGFEERELIFRARLANRPDDSDALINLVGALRDQGKLAKARETVDRLLALPQAGNAHAHARSLLAELQFLEGDNEAAWDNYRWREKWSGFKPRPHRQPEWAGEPLDGRAILVWSEQGVGDEIMFSRFLPLLADQAARVVVETDRRLVPLFQRSFPTMTVVPMQDPPAPETLAGIDFQIPIGALGQKLWRQFRDMRPAAPLVADPAAPLVADPAQSRAMRARYLAAAGTTTGAPAAARALLVGIAWRSANALAGAKKSMPLAALAPLLRRPDTVFVDLQYGDTEAERAEMQALCGVGIVHDPDFDQLKDLDSFAAQVAAMDAVVSISNTTAHVAGALGLPTAIMLSTVPMWRWGAEPTRTHWYDSVRLCRAKESGDWEAPVQAALELLAGL